MKREYENNTETPVEFFIGTEIEHTPAYNMKTLFVVGYQTIEKINSHLDDSIKHIFFGANHSYNTSSNWSDYVPVSAEYSKWEESISYFLNKGLWCSLDINIADIDEVNSGTLNLYEKFIPQIRVPIPYISNWNENTTVKIDDSTFNFSNPGVWVHSLSSLQADYNFTSWELYKNDKII